MSATTELVSDKCNECNELGVKEKCFLIWTFVMELYISLHGTESVHCGSGLLGLVYKYRCVCIVWAPHAD